jgi:hypothetical protein
MKINQYGVLFQPSLIRNLKHSMSFNCHYTFGIGARKGGLLMTLIVRWVLKYCTLTVTISARKKR